MSLTEKLGKIRLQYHLNDKAWLLPPNMRAMVRFMNLHEWVDWADKLLGCYNSLEEDMKDAYSFILPYRDFVCELRTCTKAIEHVEELCKNQGFGKCTSALCLDYIICDDIVNSHNRRASVGFEMLDYFRSQASLLEETNDIHHISSDIIGSDFGIYKAKKLKFRI